MSEERFQTLESKLVILDRIVWVGWALLSAAFLIGGWVATLEFRHRDHAGRIEKQEIMVEDLRIASARATSDTLNGHDKRIQRIEDAMSETKRALDRIELKLGSK